LALRELIPLVVHGVVGERPHEVLLEVVLRLRQLGGGEVLEEAVRVDQHLPESRREESERERGRDERLLDREHVLPEPVGHVDLGLHLRPVVENLGAWPWRAPNAKFIHLL
jgi:hypothetical protein